MSSSTEIGNEEAEFNRGSACLCPACSGSNTRIVFRRVSYGREWNLTRCDSCGHPMPTDADIRMFYSGDYHGNLRVQGDAARLLGEKYDRYVTAIKAILPSGSRTLDVGCATGLFPKMLRDAGYDASGLELNSESARWGSRQYGIEIRPVRLEDLRLNGKFDLISFTDVLEHTADPPRMLRIARNLLSNNGLLFVTFPDITSLESRYYRTLSAILRRDWLWSTCHIPKHTWEFTPRTAKLLFRRAGFDIAKFERAYHPASFRGKLRVLSLPPRILAFVPSCGSQMEFMLRKSGCL